MPPAYSSAQKAAVLQYCATAQTDKHSAARVCFTRSAAAALPGQADDTRAGAPSPQLGPLQCAECYVSACFPSSALARHSGKTSSRAQRGATCTESPVCPDCIQEEVSPRAASIALHSTSFATRLVALACSDTNSAPPRTVRGIALMLERVLDPARQQAAANDRATTARQVLDAFPPSPPTTVSQPVRLSAAQLLEVEDLVSSSSPPFAPTSGAVQIPNLESAPVPHGHAAAQPASSGRLPLHMDHHIPLEPESVVLVSTPGNCYLDHMVVHKHTGRPRIAGFSKSAPCVSPMPEIWQTLQLEGLSLDRSDSPANAKQCEDSLCTPGSSSSSPKSSQQSDQTLKASFASASSEGPEPHITGREEDHQDGSRSSASVSAPKSSAVLPSDSSAAPRGSTETGRPTQPRTGNDSVSRNSAPSTGADVAEDNAATRNLLSVPMTRTPVADGTSSTTAPAGNGTTVPMETSAAGLATGAARSTDKDGVATPPVTACSSPSRSPVGTPSSISSDALSMLLEYERYVALQQRLCRGRVGGCLFVARVPRMRGMDFFADARACLSARVCFERTEDSLCTTAMRFVHSSTRQEEEPRLRIPNFDPARPLTRRPASLTRLSPTFC